MAKPVIQSVMEMVAERPDVDNRQLFDSLWGIVAELRAMVDARFALEEDPSAAGLQPYQSRDNSARGFLSVFAGAEIDWLVHSWIGVPERSFTNMHLTISLGSQVRVPHFGLALGTMPDIFYYNDYIPRTDPVADIKMIDRYLEPANQEYLELCGDERFAPFVSKTLYMRASQSHISHCWMTKPSEETVALIRRQAITRLERWIRWVDEAEEVPQEERPALAARDLLVRRTICERDPANAISDRLFGEELTARLVRTLWGGDRALPRAG